MLTRILKLLGTCRLFKCRLVSRHWSSVSTEILTTRPDSHLTFHTHGGVVKIKSASVERLKRKKSSLTDFVKCIKRSKNCPYSRFSFKINLAFFENREWTEFVSSCWNKVNSATAKQNPNQNMRLKYLDLDVSSVYSPDSYHILAEKVRDLLVLEIPQLEEFRLYFSFPKDGVDIKSLKLFPPSQNTEPEVGREKEIKTTAIPVPVQLPHLKVLEVEIWMFERVPGIIGDLLNAAVNLKTLLATHPEDCPSEFSVLEMLAFLQPLGKLHLLQDVRMIIHEEFYRALYSASTSFRKSTQPQTETETETQNLDFGLGCKLRGLKLYNVVGGRVWTLLCPKAFPDVLWVISNLLEASKNTLRQLQMTQLGDLPGLKSEFQLPKFPNLTTLTLREMTDFAGNEMDSQEPFFPPKTRLEQVFPAVRELCFYVENCGGAFPAERGVPRLESVKTVRLIDRKITAATFPMLTLMCPNLNKLQIHKNRVVKYFHPRTESDYIAWNNVECSTSAQLNLLETGRWIWTHMKQLESLEIDLDLDAPQNNSRALDSWLTGMSTTRCFTHQLLKEETPEFQSNLRRGPLQLARMTRRDHPSILDMKELKRLTINPYSGAQLLDKREFIKKLTWLSQEYAFKLMPNLKINED